MNLGIVVNNLGNSDQSLEVINLINYINEKDNKVSPCIFFQNNIPNIVDPNCLTMNISGLSNFKGKVVAFGLDSAQIVNENNSPTENWLFLWDLPWLYTVMSYEICQRMLSNFKILVRSESHKNNVENYTGRKDIQVIDTLDDLYKCLIKTR